MSTTGMRPLRVLYVAHASNLTGASRSLIDILRVLDRNLICPTVLLPKRGPLCDKLDELGIEYLFIPYVTCTKSRKKYKPDWVKRSINLVAARRLASLLRSRGFNLVHNNSLLVDVGMRAARIDEVPYVCHIREFVLEDHDMHFIDEVRVRENLRKSSMNIFISHAVEGKFLTWAPETPYAVMYDGIDSASYNRYHRRLFSSGQTNLLLAGRFAPGKGQLEAVKGLNELCRRGIVARLVLVGGSGDDDYREKVLEYVADYNLGEYVKVLDFANDISALRSEADICLTCSSNEAMGRVTIESMMAGCLVVAAGVGATRELVRDGETGLLYDWGKPAAIADSVQWALSNPESSRIIAEQGRAWALEAFDVNTYVETMTKCYETIVDSRFPSIASSSELNA